ncbi:MULTISPECIES: hypothetical protein [Priestia]|jgi:hypothetical protein|uniref:Phosphatidate cytidylyltransferase n=3 Tax=Priestia TaxID=2800373 RepID=A0AAX6BHT2_PRIMG|nr:MULTISPECIES: hypothetical protein [Priestia]MBK0290688.1 hypothetical protein [Bacillus sp. S34]MCL9634193.1 hypothetical protein [Bacillus zanthoxyli]NHH94591.1 hypothetical protein [Bacillus sp. MB95]UPK48483.1 hypothetical protein MT476_17595 [Bacillus sp. H8-1]AKP76740.1 hypothetical protein AS52_01775 [Priestia megaterium Q3]
MSNYEKTKNNKNIILGIIYALIVISVYAFNLHLQIALSILTLVIIFELVTSIKEDDKAKNVINIITICLFILGIVFL